jgi:RND family efflux transporter MFP subunit
MRITLPQWRKPTGGTPAIVLAAVLVCTVFLLLQHKSEQAPVRVSVSPVGTANKPLYLEKQGAVVQADLVPVYSEGAGRVQAVYVKAGQAVKAGQPLAELLISRSGAPNKALQVPVSAVAGSSVAANTEYENALKEYNQYQRLYTMGAIARKKLEQAEARLKAAQNGVSEGAGAKGRPESAISEKATAAVSGPVTVRAAVDGVISGSVVTAGSEIQDGQELMEIGSGKKVEVVAPLAQGELDLVRPGTPVGIELGTQQLAGQVAAIYPEVKNRKIAAFAVHIKLTGKPGKLPSPGMAATVSIATGREATVAAVPDQAVRRDEKGGYYVFLAVDGRAMRKQVEIGAVIGGLREIKTALPQGSLVITGNIDRLKNGDAVQAAE